MSEQLEKIINQVQSEDIKVVSFDIFDTLLLRPTVSPTDLFKLVGKKAGFVGDFREMRVFAEREARKYKAFNVDDVTLDQIYNQLAELFDIEPIMLDLLKKTELEVEYKLLYPRKSVQKIYSAAVEAKKRIIITSDMYLPKEFLEKVLTKNGYVGFERFYLSCEVGKAKGTGKLFEKIVQDFSTEDIAPNEIIHVGDNYHADIKQAVKFQIKTAYIPNIMNEFKRRGRLNELVSATHKNIDNVFLIGFAANIVFDDPFTPFKLDSYFNGDEIYFANILIAPLLLSFSKWLMEESINDGIDLLVFTFRDGYIPLQIFELLKNYYDKTPEDTIIYLSRAIRLSYFAKMSNGLFNSINDLPVSPDMSVIEFIRKRLMINTEEEENEVLELFLKSGYTSRNEKIGNLNRYVSLIKRLEGYFLKNGQKMIKSIDKYCRNQIAQDRTIGIFDVGYRGSVSRFLKDNFDKSNIGYHLFATPLIDIDQNNNYNLKSYVKYGINTTQRTVILHSLIEDIISSQEGSATGVYEEDGNLYIQREQSKNNDLTIKRIQEEVINYCDNFIKLFNDDIKLLDFDHYLHFEFMEKFLAQPNKIDGSLICKLRFYDSEFITNSEHNKYEEWYNRFFKHHSSLQHKKFNFYKFKYKVFTVCSKLRILPVTKAMYQPLKKIIEKDRILIDHKSLIQNEIAQSIQTLQQKELLKRKKNILIVGDMVSFDKGSCHYLNTLSESMQEYNFVLLSEATWVSLDQLHRKIHFPVINVPSCFGKNLYPPNYNVSNSSEVKEKINEKDYLKWAVDNWKARHTNIGKGYPEFLAYCAEEYYTSAIDILKPETIIMWNQFHALHHIISSIAKNKGIPIIYMEFGSLPGTFALESYGQMGESYPAQQHVEFKKLKLTTEEIEEAKDIISYLKSSKLNRNVQSTLGNIEDIKKQLKQDRPIIFYAGQNDYESGLYPYTEHTKKFHSPIFKSSHEALLFLSRLAEENDWNLIYKPHPIINMFNSESKKIPDNVIYVKEADINDLIDISDVTVTILSQVGYISLIREKPTVMLGYTQLRGKDCTYEAFQVNEVEGTIRTALAKGYTQKQREALILHTGQMLKYYLYNDLIQKDRMYGLDIEEAITLIENVSAGQKI